MTVKKWWLYLALGTLLVITGLVILYLSPDQGHAGYKTPVIILALLCSLVEISGYFIGNTGDKDAVEMMAGILLLLVAIVYLNQGSATRQNTGWAIHSFMVLTALLVFYKFWQYKSEINWWWLTILQLFFTGYLLLLPHSEEVRTALVDGPGNHGFQFLVSGILLIVLAMISRNLEKEYTKTLMEIIQSKR